MKKVLSPSITDRFILYRIGLDPLEINQNTRNVILKAMSESKRFIQIGNYTIMINSINGIEPIIDSSKEPLKLPEKISEKDRLTNIKKMDEVRKKLAEKICLC